MKKGKRKVRLWAAVSSSRLTKRGQTHIDREGSVAFSNRLVVISESTPLTSLRSSPPPSPPLRWCGCCRSCCAGQQKPKLNELLIRGQPVSEVTTAAAEVMVNPARFSTHFTAFTQCSYWVSRIKRATATLLWSKVLISGFKKESVL